MKIVVVVLSKYSRNGNRIFCWTLRNPFTFRQVNDLRTLALLDRLTSELSIDAFAAFVPISARPLKTMHDKGVEDADYSVMAMWLRNNDRHHERETTKKKGRVCVDTILMTQR